MVSKTKDRSFAAQSTPARAFGAVIAPAILGALSGLVLGWSAPVYWVVQVIAIVGGFFAGTEHATWKSGALRGVVGGAVFGALLLAVRALTGWSDKASLGKTPGLEVIVTAIAGAILGAAGAALAARRRKSTGAVV